METAEMEVEARNTREALAQIDVPHALSNELLALGGVCRMLDALDEERLAEVAAMMRNVGAELERKADGIQNTIDTIANQMPPTFRESLEADAAARKAAEVA
jgi:hypothetical protein